MSSAKCTFTEWSLSRGGLDTTYAMGSVDGTLFFKSRHKLLAGQALRSSALLARLFGDRGLELNCVVRFDNSAVGEAVLQAGAGMMLLRADHAIQGEHDGHLAISPIVQAEIPLSIAHQSARRSDPLILAFLDAAKAPWPDMKPVPAPVPSVQAKSPPVSD